MKKKTIFLFFGVFATFIQIQPYMCLHAQIRDDSELNRIASKFDTAAAKHKLELRDLSMARRVIVRDYKQMTSEVIQADLVRRGYEKDTGVLFYSYDNGIIGIVPFAVLQPFGSDSFLIDRVSISIAPSLFDIDQRDDGGFSMTELNSISRSEHVNKSFLIVGNPDLSSDAELILPPLPGAEKEARMVAHIFKATPLIGKSATKAAVLERLKNEELAFLYFATHAVASGTDPLNGSSIALGGVNSSLERLTAKEVQSLRLRARIAILSACQTGLGKVHDAGIIGLARAFQIAGVFRVVMSLWSVDDDATADLMSAFIRYLNDNIPPEALRKAMIDIKKKRPNPSEWASFTFFGLPR